jgi:hypothetical protein
MLTSQIDEILVGQKESILEAIYRLAEYGAIEQDTELDRSSREIASQLIERQQFVIRKMLALIQPLWMSHDYGYKYLELESLYKRALTVNPDGTW